MRGFGMFLFVRTVLYTALFGSLILVGLPGRLPADVGPGSGPGPAGSVAQMAGGVLAAGGLILAAWAILTFLFLGKGTPAPWDPPRQLVTGGPYRWLRNPMYLGGGVALVGGALFYRSGFLLAYAAVFLFLSHCIIKGAEEPALRRRFPHQYPVYWAEANRWLPLMSVLTGRRRRITTASASR